jgi:cytochrome c oxidase subunit 3
MSRDGATTLSPAAARADRSVTNHLGMWVFLATEVLFFGGMFLAYALYRHAYPDIFRQGAREMEFWPGTINTAVLLTSSLFLAIADRAVTADRRGLTATCLTVTWLLGAAFLGIKAFEYASKFSAGLIPGRSFRSPPGTGPRLQIFFFLYFAMTGLHAVHMIAGLAAVGWLIFLHRRGELTALRAEPIAIVGLYWHFVDCVWVFLYPLFYLPGR